MNQIPEIGHFALLLCLPIAIALALLPLIGVQTKRIELMRTASLLTTGLWFFLLLAFICLTQAFLSDEFSVLLVAKHSNTALPIYYKISAVWGNHEGSLLLWSFILASWTLAVAYLGKSLPIDIHTRVLSILGMISTGFLLFIIFTSNPFERNLLNPAVEGNDLNPLLQDVGLIIHPPLLYIGYVGFSVAFAFAIAALMSGKLDAAWAKWSRPWTNVAWSFLTVGIALGSWWAYYELGWGGWWFWDPVENASFMPWLAGTALIHSLAVTEKRGVFRSWTLLLAILAFSLSLLGTFLVRSGILVSVHAFASDPTRGLFILAFLTLVIGGSLLLYALRAPTIKPTSTFNAMSRETWLLLNNMLLAAALAVVLLGTLFPLIANALNMGSYSVGPPYFNRLFLPIMIPLCLLMSIAPYLNWKQTKINLLINKAMYFSAILTILLALLLVAYLSHFYQREFSWIALSVLVICFWLLFMTWAHPLSKRNKNKPLFHGLTKFPASYWGMLIAHSGIAITGIGIGLTSIYSVQKDVRMVINDTASLASYDFQLKELNKIQGPNYTATQATLEVFYQSGNQARKKITTLFPEKRLYQASRNVMTEADIAASLTKDLYVSLGEPLDNDAWALRIYIKAFVRCIWLGALLMAIGGIIAILDKRYRVKRASKVNHSDAIRIKATIENV